MNRKNGFFDDMISIYIVETYDKLIEFNMYESVFGKVVIELIVIN